MVGVCKYNVSSFIRLVSFSSFKKRNRVSLVSYSMVLTKGKNLILYGVSTHSEIFKMAKASLMHLSCSLKKLARINLQAMPIEQILFGKAPSNQTFLNNRVLLNLNK